MRNDWLKLFFCYSRVTVRSLFQYRTDAILKSLAVFMRESTGIIVIYFTLMQFDSINGWNIHEMIFLFSLLFITYGLLIIFFTGLRDLGFLIQEGRFDRLMLRPRGILFQIIAANTDWFAAIGHGCLGLTLFVISAGNVGATWNVLTIGYYLLAIIGGVLIQGAIFLFFASMNFYLIKTDNLREIFYWNMRRFAGYPISIFHKAIQGFLIYVIPLAFVNYFPAQFILRKSDMADFPAFFMYITPLVGILMYTASYLFWRKSIGAYKSTGN